jgi:hypothetical protein
MYTFFLLAVLASGPSDLQLADRLTTNPPLLISAIEEPPVAPTVRAVATVALVGGWAGSIVNTTAFWLSRNSSVWAGIGGIFGVLVSSVPFFGPVIAVTADLGLGPTSDDPSWGGRIALNGLSFAAQLGGLIFFWSPTVSMRRWRRASPWCPGRTASPWATAGPSKEARHAERSRRTRCLPFGLRTVARNPACSKSGSVPV